MYGKPLTKIRRLRRWTADVGLLLAVTAIGLAAARSSRAFAPQGRFSVGTSTDTIVDTQTHLIWQAVDSVTTHPWTDAVAYCQNLTLGGTTGWRLPTVAELLTLVDDSRADPAIDPVAFPTMPTDNLAFWTSSSILAGFNSTYAWTVSFQEGVVAFAFGPTSLHVRCVASSPP